MGGEVTVESQLGKGSTFAFPALYSVVGNEPDERDCCLAVYFDVHQTPVAKS